MSTEYIVEHHIGKCWEPDCQTTSVRRARMWEKRLIEKEGLTKHQVHIVRCVRSILKKNERK